MKAADLINSIGEELARCSKKCKGIANRPDEGIIPRCLIVENEPIAVVIAGINPGKCNRKEREYYLGRQGYTTIKDHWDVRIKGLKYYAALRKLSKELGYGDGILWTELVKCENDRNDVAPPLQTFRVCIKNYLERELKAVPEVPIMAVGNKVFEALSYRFPDRFIIGVPHPTGSYGHFSKLFENGRLKEKYVKAAKESQDDYGNRNSVKLFPD